MILWIGTYEMWFQLLSPFSEGRRRHYLFSKYGSEDETIEVYIDGVTQQVVLTLAYLSGNPSESVINVSLPIRGNETEPHYVAWILTSTTELMGGYWYSATLVLDGEVNSTSREFYCAIS